MTGRGMGFCAGNAHPGYANVGGGRGCGRGFARGCNPGFMPGRGQFGAYPDAMPVVDEKAAIQNQADYLEKQLNQVRDRLKELD